MASYPRVSVEHYTRWLMTKGTFWHFRANMRLFKYPCSPGFQKYAIKTFLKILIYHRVMIVSVTPSRHEFLLALWNFLCICCWRLISILLRTFFFEFFFFFFFDRTLSANASPCQCTGTLSPLKPEVEKTHVP